MRLTDLDQHNVALLLTSGRIAARFEIEAEPSLNPLAAHAGISVRTYVHRTYAVHSNSRAQCVKVKLKYGACLRRVSAP